MTQPNVITPENIVAIRCCKCNTSDGPMCLWRDEYYCYTCLWDGELVMCCPHCYEDYAGKDMYILHRMDVNGDEIDCFTCCPNCAYEHYRLRPLLYDNHYKIVSERLEVTQEILNDLLVRLRDMRDVCKQAGQDCNEECPYRIICDELDMTPEKW